MFVALYRWRIKPGMEKDFEHFWRTGTPMFRDEHGALGSRLHVAEDGTYFAYAQWPSREIYFMNRTLSPAHSDNQMKMKECILESFPPLLGEVMNDLIVRK